MAEEVAEEERPRGGKKRKKEGSQSEGEAGEGSIKGVSA